MRILLSMVLLSFLSLPLWHAFRERPGSSSRVYAFRLRPGQDLKRGLLDFARAHRLRAASVVTCVGSLQRLHVRFANQDHGTVLEGKYEIVSLVGTFHADEGGHFHLSVADEQGQMVGGHLLEGNLVYTTAEVVVVEATQLEFRRTPDEATGYRELEVCRR